MLEHEPHKFNDKSIKRHCVTIPEPTGRAKEKFHPNGGYLMNSHSFFNFWANRPSTNNAPVLGSIGPLGYGGQNFKTGLPAPSLVTGDNNGETPPTPTTAYGLLEDGQTQKGLEKGAASLANALIALGNVDAPQTSSMQLKPVRGPSAEQSQALLRLLQNMQSKTNNGGMI